MSKDLAGEILLDETKLKGHGKIVMDALGAAVECLDDSTQLTSLLIGIGERHALYGVQPNMIPVCICFKYSFCPSWLPSVGPLRLGDAKRPGGAKRTHAWYQKQ